MFNLSYEVHKSIFIQKSAADIYHFISNFNHWNTWSPWVCIEPEVKTTTTGQPTTLGHRHFWDGERIGSGEMIIQELTAQSQINCDLNFFKPWKSQSKVTFNIEKLDQGTKVTWSMKAQIPFFMIFFKKMMVAFIGRDFQRGLSMLKELLETGKVLSVTQVKEKSKRSGFFAVGIKTETDISQIGQSTSNDFSKLNQYLQSGKLPKPDMMLDFTHQFDIVNGKCVYTAALAYNKKIEVPSDLNLIQFEVGEHQAVNILHTGAYSHLGNAWATAMTIQRQEKLKKVKNCDPYEIYLNNPMGTETQDLQTLVVVPYR